LDTKPEKILRQWLWRNGYRYRLHLKGLPGKPDIVFPGRRKAIFIHDCFWHKHGCKYFQWPASNPDFWRQKIEDNVERDQRNYTALKNKGWDCLVAWECDLKKKEQTSLLKRVQKFLKVR
jgi:DNA mismatch endonuclease (patch repair protein)